MSEEGDSEREYDEELQATLLAAARGLFDEAAEHSARALALSRRLYQDSPNRARHRPVLAGALYNHAGHLRRAQRPAEAIVLLTESGELYRVLAAEDPAAYQVKQIDVLVRTALARRAMGDREGAVGLLRDAVHQYPNADTDNPLESDLGAARAHFHLGRCLLELGARPEEALAEIDEGLFAAERARQDEGIEARDFRWLAEAPQSFRLIAPDWTAAAMLATMLHEAAENFEIAADAANIAVRVSGGMAALGGPANEKLYEQALARAQKVWSRAEERASTRPRAPGALRDLVIRDGGLGFADPDLQAFFQTAGWIEDAPPQSQ